MESYDLSGRLYGSLDLAQTVVSTLHGSLQTNAEPVMVKCKLLRKGSALSLGLATEGAL